MKILLAFIALNNHTKIIVVFASVLLIALCATFIQGLFRVKKRKRIGVHVHPVEPTVYRRIEDQILIDPYRQAIDSLAQKTAEIKSEVGQIKMQNTQILDEVIKTSEMRQSGLIREEDELFWQQIEENDNNHLESEAATNDIRTTSIEEMKGLEEKTNKVEEQIQTNKRRKVNPNASRQILVD